jgi:hypothetical protein
VDLTVSVLSMAYWPTYTPMEVTIPPGTLECRVKIIIYLLAYLGYRWQKSFAVNRKSAKL